MLGDHTQAKSSRKSRSSFYRQGSAKVQIRLLIKAPADKLKGELLIVKVRQELEKLGGRWIVNVELCIPGKG
jgi:hypothetical protein